MSKSADEDTSDTAAYAGRPSHAGLTRGDSSDASLPGDSTAHAAPPGEGPSDHAAPGEELFSLESSPPTDVPIYADASADPAPEQIQDDDDRTRAGYLPAAEGSNAPVLRIRIRRMRATANLSNLEGAAGSPERLFGRVWAMPLPWIQAGLVAEKDPGESIRHGFASGYLRVGPRDGGMEFIFGDYRVETGSGILLGRPSFSVPGSRLFPGAKAGAWSLRPHASADESRFFRGAAARLEFGADPRSVSAMLFASSVRRSGRIDSSGRFSPYLAGLFRTASELERLNTDHERLGGVLASLRQSRFRIAFAGLWTEHEYPVQFEQRPEAPARAWAGGSIDAHVTAERFELSVEAAWSRAASVSFEGRLTPSHNLTALLQFQSVRPGFYAPYGAGLSGRSTAGNRHVGNLSCLIRPVRWARVVLAAVMISNEGPESDDPLPATRVRFSAEAEMWLTPAWSVLLFAGSTRADGGITQSDAQGRSLRVMRENDRSTMRVQSVVDGGAKWTLRNRVDLVSSLRAAQGVRERGVLFQTDFKWQVVPGMRASLRACMFDVNGWGARIYSAEQDVEGAMRIPVFVGRGVRLYALLRWQFIPAVALSCRFGVTFRDSVPRGPSLESNTAEEERELSLQLDAAW